MEVVANATVPITYTKGGVTRTYHPQTEALLQWFEMGATQTPSVAHLVIPTKLL